MRWRGEKPKPPSGTWGLAIQLVPRQAGWPIGDDGPVDVVAVAADWSNPDSAVLTLDQEGQWQETGLTAADFALVPERALAMAVEQYEISTVGGKRALRTRPVEIY